MLYPLSMSGTFSGHHHSQQFVYTFFGHLKWTWAIAIGYALSIWVHFLVNGHLMDVALNSQIVQ